MTQPDRLSRRRVLHHLATLGVMSVVPPGVVAATDAGLDWQPAAPLPIATQELYPVVHDGRLVVAGGIAARLRVPYFTDRSFAYDADQDRWQELPRLPQPIHHAALVSGPDGLELMGGFHGGYTHLWRMRDAIHRLQDGRWERRGSLPVPQAEGVLSVAPDGALHLVTGQSPRGNANRQRSDHQETTAHWRRAPGAARWEAAAPIPTARNSASGGWLGETLVIAGGRTAEGNLSHTERYDAQEDRWRTGAPLPLPQAGTAAVVHEDTLIVLGGEIFVPQAGVFPNVWRYDGAQDRWQALPDLRTPRHGLGAGLLGKRLHAIGGATEPSGNGTSNANEYLLL
ncbi:MAG: kelch repeat-containing protein [Pseudomonadota bacterium]